MLLTAFGNYFHTNDFGLATIVMEILVLYVSAFALVWPASQTSDFRLPDWSDTPHPDDVNTLEDTLNFLEGREAFRNHLEKSSGYQAVFVTFEFHF